MVISIIGQKIVEGEERRARPLAEKGRIGKYWESLYGLNARKTRRGIGWGLDWGDFLIQKGS